MSDFIKSFGDDEYVEDQAVAVFDYQKKGDPERTPYRSPVYKVWNANPQNPGAEPTPGIVMTTFKFRENNAEGRPQFDKEIEVVEGVNAVLLFSSFGRELNRGSGKTFGTVCSSHDGVTPSVKISKPLCGKTTAEDVAAVFSKWRGYDHAKVAAKVSEVTEDGKLSVCGIKAKDGFIMLCPHASEKKDEDTGQRGPCRPHIFVKAYDVDRKREFQMQLAGGSIQSGKFIAPYHSFFKFLQEQTKEVNGKTLNPPSYVYQVRLSPLPVRANFVLNVSNYTPIEDKETRLAMRDRAVRAKEMYEKRASYGPFKNTPTPPKTDPPPATVSFAKQAPPAEAEDPLVSNAFDEDDIPF